MNMRTPVGIPKDYPELFDIYQPLIEHCSSRVGMTPLEILDYLRKSKAIESFSLEKAFPTFLDLSDVLGYLGITRPYWIGLLKAMEAASPIAKFGNVSWSKFHPHMAGFDHGDVSSSKVDVLYYGPDILKISNLLEGLGVPPKNRPVCVGLSLAFKFVLRLVLGNIPAYSQPKPPNPPKLEEVVSDRPSSKPPPLPRLKEAPSSQPCLKLVYHPKLEKEEASDQPPSKPAANWPSDLPKDNNELLAMYGDYIIDQVKRNSKIRTEEEVQEVLQHTWVSLCNSQVVEKFAESAQTKLASTMTLEESLGYLGINLSQWTNAFNYRQRAKMWVPRPVNGGPFSQKSLFMTVDIQTLDSSGFLVKSRNPVRKLPELSGRGFKSYLGRAISNHFKNLLRTRGRRHKERCLDTTTILSQDQSGVYQKAYCEDVGNWEDSLISKVGCGMEEMIDLAEEMRRNDVDPTSEVGLRTLDGMSNGMTIKVAARMGRRG